MLYQTRQSLFLFKALYQLWGLYLFNLWLTPTLDQSFLFLDHSFDVLHLGVVQCDFSEVNTHKFVLVLVLRRRRRLVWLRSLFLLHCLVQEGINWILVDHLFMFGILGVTNFLVRQGLTTWMATRLRLLLCDVIVIILPQILLITFWAVWPHRFLLFLFTEGH